MYFRGTSNNYYFIKLQTKSNSMNCKNSLTFFSNSFAYANFLHYKFVYTKK